MDIINIGVGDKTDFRSKSFLMDYYRENKEYLRQFKMYNINNGIVTLLANNSGWCTVVSENTGAIIQLWAGELSLC